MAHDELISALESATEGSRELDDQINEALGNDYETHCPRYTTSIDAALTLVPEGWGGEVFWHDGASARNAYVDLRLPNPRWDEPDCPPEEYCTYAALVDSYESGEDDPHPLPQGRPLALAICIASMKARKARESGNG
jgi:hypothetical protein